MNAHPPGKSFASFRRSRGHRQVHSLGLMFLLVFALMIFSHPAEAVPPAPTPLGPANGASVLVPSTISWSTVTDPTGAGIIGYNWKLSTSSSLAPVTLMDSTSGTTTQDTVSGLVPGNYFWQVQAANSAGQLGDWSAIRSFTVTGVGPGTPGTPVLAPQPYSTFHPWESVQFNWSAVPNAPTYRLEVSNDPNFPLGTVPPGIVTFWNDNIRATTDGFITHPSLGEGTFFARVFATDSDFAGGVRSLPSNVIQYSVFYNNPVQPPPTPLSPVNNPTLTLPITLNWTEMPIPQPMGYDGQISSDPSFSTNEAPFFAQLTQPTFNILSLTPGLKFWRVRSTQGLRTPDLPAFTDWSGAGSFTISSAPATVVSVAPLGNPEMVMYSGASGAVRVQLTAAVPAGVTVALASSHPTQVPVPSTVTVPGNSALAEFPMTVGQVTSPTQVTLTATLNGLSTSNQFTLRPPTLNDDPLQSLTKATGGATMFGWVDLEGGGLAAPGGFAVNLSTDSPAASVPMTVNISAGFRGAGFQINTAPVTTTTVVRITASAGGITTQWPITLTPAPTPSSFFVRPLSTTNGSQGIVTTAPAGFDQIMQVASSNPGLATVPTVVTVSAGSGIGRFNITTAPVTQPTVVTISVSSGGATMSSPLTLYPTLPALTAITVNPTSVVGGTSSTGTVRLSAAAPAGGVAINIETQLPLVASVPASVTVPGGATSASFTVTTFPSFLTTVQLSAALDNMFQFTAITVTPPPVGPTISAVSLSQDSVVGGNSITVTVTLSAPAPTGGAVVSLSDNSSTIAVPASVTVPAGATTATFTVTTSTVTTSTSATISTTYAGVTQTVVLSVNSAAPAPPPVPAAPSLISPADSATAAQPITFDWSDVANAVTYEIQIDDSSTITAPFRANQTVNVSQVTITGLPAQRLWWRVRAINAAGVAGPFSSTRRFTAQAAPAMPAPASLSAVSINPTSVVGGNFSTGTVTLTAAAPSGGALVTLSSSNTAVATVPASVTVPVGATSATVTVTTPPLSVNTSVTLNASYNGVNRTATLTVTPVPPPASLSAVTLNPTSVTGGTTSQGTVTLTSAAPSGGLVVSLSSDAGAATVPASVTVAAGATSAPFTITTTTVINPTTVTVTGSSGGAVRTTILTVNPPGQSVTLTVTASGRSGERIMSSPAGINVLVGSTGSAGFTSGTAITLSVSNGRDAVWSGACSSGGNKTKTCTFTITGNASVTGNVQ